MCSWGAAIAAVFAVAAGYQQAESQKAAARYENAVAKQNADVAETQAKYAQQLGNIEEERQRARVRQMLGKQRATFAANNVDASQGTAVDIMGETAMFGEEDALAIRANAARQAWGFKVDANNSRARGKLALATGKNQATGTYLSTAASVFNSSYQYAGG